MSSFSRARDQASTEGRGGICRHHKGWRDSGWSGLGIGVQVDIMGASERPLKFQERLETTVLRKTSFTNVVANLKYINKSNGRPRCMRIIVTWCRGGADLPPSPPCSGNSQGPILLNVAGAVPKLKYSSGIFISFWDHHEKSFQWFRFCEKKSAVVLFFLEAVEEAHLWSISEKRRGQGMGDTPSRLDRTLDGDRRTRVRVAVWFGWAPSPLEMKGCLAQGGARPRHYSGQAVRGWEDRTGFVALGT